MVSAMSSRRAPISNANENAAEDIEDEDAEDADDEDTAAGDAHEEADEAEDAKDADDEADVWKVSSSPSAHVGPASVVGIAADCGGVSSRLRPLRSRPRCRAWIARAWPSVVSR